MDYPITVSIPKPEQSSRLLALATLFLGLPKVLLLIPHLIALYFLGLFMIVTAILGQIGVVFTGKYPTELFAIVSGILRWQFRVNAYLLGLTDSYPPFKLRQ